MTEVAAPPAHVSYSQLSSWLRCGKAYELERIIGVPSVLTWAQVAGSAVHEATERIDRGDITPVRDLWLDVFASVIERESERTDTSPEDWRATGRRTKALPTGEDYRFWKAQGAVMVNRWKSWRIANKQWVIATVTTPESSSVWDGIELPLVIRFDDVVTQGILDRLFVNDLTGELMVVDLKSGVWAPKDAGQQLGLYATGLEQLFGTRPQTGAYWMARTGAFASDPINLDHFSQDYWRQVTTKFSIAKSEGIFLPSPGMFCGSCSVRDYCATVGGRHAHLADSLSTDS